MPSLAPETMPGQPLVGYPTRFPPASAAAFTVHPLVASRIINRAGAEALTAAAVAAELSCSEDEAREGLRKLQPVLVTCQQRTIALVLRIRDSAFVDGDLPQSAFVALIRGFTEAYLREDVQP